MSKEHTPHAPPTTMNERAQQLLDEVAHERVEQDNDSEYLQGMHAALLYVLDMGPKPMIED